MRSIQVMFMATLVAMLCGFLVTSACGPTTTSDADVRYHCAKRMYSARNDLAAEILFESCLAKYGKTP